MNKDVHLIEEIEFMSEFKVGEIVICVKAGNPADWGFGAEAYFGLECEILELSVYVCAWGPRHRVRFQDGVTAQMTEDFLRKRPDDNHFTQWFETHIITDIRPTEIQVALKDTMERVRNNLGSYTSQPSGGDGDG